MALKAANVPHTELNRPNGMGARHEGIDKVWSHVQGRFTFGFARNPITWLQSRWAYTARSRGGRRLPFWSTDFNEWVVAVLTHRPGFVCHAMIRRLGYRLVDGQWKAGEHPVDFVGKTENLVDDFVRALSLAGEEFDEEIIRQQLPQKVCSRNPKWQERTQYQPEVLKMVVEVNQPIFELFEYREVIP